MDTLFSSMERQLRAQNAPLAARMRPQTLEGYVGQERAVGPGSWLRNAIEHDTLSSVLLYGPAGTGKTTLARIIAHSTHAEFVEVSAITGTVKEQHVIDQQKCIKCGNCMATCKFGAIIKE
jgi:putative ATPase